MKNIKRNRSGERVSSNASLSLSGEKTSSGTMNRILSIFLIMVLTAGMISITGAVSFSDISGEEYERDIEALVILGIVEGYSDGSFGPANPVTRAEFCQMLIKLSGFNAEEIAPTQVFYKDVPSSHWGFRAIGHATQQGYVSGYSDGLFLPDNPISYGEANKILINLLGYKYRADISGGYPGGYQHIGRQLGLSKGIGIEYYDNINRGEVCRLISNALDVPLVTLSSIGGNEVYEIDNSRTILGENLKYGRKTAKVSANQFFSIGNGFAAEKCLLIDGVNYYYTSRADMDYVGKTVTFMYKIEEYSAFDRIVQIIDKTEKELVIYSNQSIQYANGKITYNISEERTATVSVAANATTSYNGALANFSPQYIDDLTDNSGYIRLIASEGGAYDVLQIKVYESMAVGVIKPDTKIITSSDFSESINLNDYEEYSIFNSSNEEIDFTQIPIGAALSYCISEGGTYLEGIVTEAKKSGVIQALGSDGGWPYAIVDDEKIYLNEAAYGQISAVPIGEMVSIYVDSLGNGVFVEMLIRDEINVKYLAKIRVADGGMESVVHARFFDMTNGLQDYQFAKSVIIDGQLERDMTTQKLYDYGFRGTAVEIVPEKGDIPAVTADSTVGQMLDIKVNEDNLITEINTPATYRELMENSGRDGFCEVSAFGMKRYSSDTTSLDNKIPLDRANSRIMVVPRDLENALERDFRIATYTYFISGTSYETAAYHRNKNFSVPEMIVVRFDNTTGNTSATLSHTDRIGTIARISDAIDEDGVVRRKYTTFEGSAERFFYYDPHDNLSEGGTAAAKLDASELKVGDIIHYGRDSRNFLTGFIRYYEPVGKVLEFDFKAETRNKTYTHLDNPTIMLETVIRRKDSRYISVSDPKETGNPYDCYLFANYDNVTLMRINANGDIYVSAGKLDDVHVNDKVIVHVSYSMLRTIIVINDERV